MTMPTADASLITVPLPSEEDLVRVMSGSYDADRTLNVMKMFAGTEDMYPAVVAFIRAVFQAKGVDPKLREMIVLRVASKFHVRYEWDAQSRLASNVGLSPEEIAAAASDNPGEGIAAEYRLAWKATDELCIEGTLCDETLAQLLHRYGDTVTRKLILIISWFNLLSCFINGCRVPLETTDKIGTRASPVK
jgi:alkylhydroperoxidase family enzyme